MRFAVLLALLVLTSGCLGGADTNPKNDPRPDPTPSPTPDPGPAPTPPARAVVLLSGFAFTDCSGVEAHFAVAADQAQALLPENFTVRDDQGSGSEALARYRIFSCPTFTATTSTLNDTVYGDVSLLIEDPGMEQSGDAAWYRFRIFSADDILATAWDISGYDVVTGAVTMGTTPLTQKTISFEGYQAQWLETVDGMVVADEVSYTSTPAGTLVWGESVTPAAAVKIGLGTFDVPSDDPLAGLLSGDPTKVQLFVHGDTDISEAQLVRLTSTG